MTSLPSPASTLALPQMPLPGWQAHLKLGFAARAGQTFLAERRHLGPLRVQKPLYPEGEIICHAIIVHPPGGIAGGDTLEIEVEVGAGSHAVLATPGASKWYKSNQRTARQSVTLQVREQARLDWLPQNNIVFDHAIAKLDLKLVLDPSASAIGWDATQLGRQAAGEHWSAGSLRSNTTLIRPDGQLLWTERALLHAEDPLRLAPQGLAGWPAFGTLWACGPACQGDIARALTERLAEQLPFDEQIRAGITCLPGDLLLIRVLARKMETLQNLLTACWTQLRPAIHGVAALPLRIWST